MVFNAVIKVCLLLTFIIRRVIANDNERQFQQTIARKKKSGTTSFKSDLNSTYSRITVKMGILRVRVNVQSEY